MAISLTTVQADDIGNTVKQLPVASYTTASERPATDWIIDSRPFKAAVRRSDDGKTVFLENGLIRRVFRIEPNAATVGLDNCMTGESELRAIRPEAVLVLNGKTVNVGGLTGQPVQNFLLSDWLDTLQSDPKAFQLAGVSTGKTKERFGWKPTSPDWLSSPRPWPPPGVSLVFNYKAPAGYEGISVDVCYELFDGAPIISKWIKVRNDSAKSVRLNSFKSEILALADTAPKIDSGAPREWRMLSVNDKPPGNYPDAPREYIDRFTQLFVVTDYAMGGDMEAMKDNPGVRWVHDHPEYEKTGIRYYGQYKPTRVECTPIIGPDIDIESGATWESFRAFELLRDSTDRERRGLAEQRLWQLASPWSQENPILMHVRSSKPEDVRAAIDQCAEVGFEMVIMTFGSGFNILDKKPEFLARMKELGEYAKSKGIALGGYSLLASRGGKTEDRIISPTTGQPAKSRKDGARFGATPCMATEWGTDYFQTIQSFFEQTGMNVFENDGSYPGDLCASTEHTGHKGVKDSQWKQWEKIRDFYRWACANGVYLNVPDWHFLNGANKIPMGYVETNWSLPRAQQEIIERQNIFDGTWEKTPTMGFMFVPLTQYHGGGAAATIEPLSEHLDHYETRLANLFGAGVQACYRGPRLYDTDKTKELVTKWVSYYKSHRAILDSPVIHLRRPDGKDWDGLLHVNPQLSMCGLAMIYNPLNEPITRTIRLPLYYTGLTDKAKVRVGDDSGSRETDATLARDYTIEVKVTVPAKGRTPVYISK
jgi:hypothetical protein